MIVVIANLIMGTAVAMKDRTAKTFILNSLFGGLLDRTQNPHKGCGIEVRAYRGVGTLIPFNIPRNTTYKDVYIE